MNPSRLFILRPVATSLLMAGILFVAAAGNIDNGYATAGTDTGPIIVHGDAIDREASALMARIAELHSYDVPCIVTWPVDKLFGAYADWVEASVG